MNQKGHVLLIVLLISAAIFGYLIYSGKINLPQKQSDQTTQIPTVTRPVPTDTAETVYTESDQSVDWKTYTNKEYGYSIKYPSNWYVYELKNYPYGGFPGIPGPGDAIITTLSHFPNFTPDKTEDFVGVEISVITSLNPDLTTGLDLAKRIELTRKADKESKIDELTINGNKVYKIYSRSNLQDYLAVYIPYRKEKSGWVHIRVPYTNAEFSSENNVDQILSTFKFTN